MRNKNANIQDVARVAGVSTATVSRALSQPAKVSPATRESVLEAVQETGYVVNQAARNLRRQSTDTIVVLVPDLGNPFFSNILKAIEAVTQGAGYSVLLADTKIPEIRDKLVRTYLTRGRADGVILLDGSISSDLIDAAMAADAVPPVLFACEWSRGTPLMRIAVDNVSGAQMALQHLIDLGHRKIGHVTGPAGNILSQERQTGLDAILAKADVTIPDNWVFEGDFMLDSGKAAGNAWLALSDRPTAVFCACDRMAFGFISSLAKAGFSVPRDVSVVGFDDIEISSSFIPGLTTVRQPRELLGERAAKTVLNMINAPDQSHDTRPALMPVELIIRDSTAPATAPLANSRADAQ